MAYEDDPEVFSEAYALYLKGNYQHAYDLVTGAMSTYPQEAQRLFSWRFDMAARMGKPDQAEDLLEEALDNGYFYSEFALRKDEDMRDMQGRPRFEALVTRNFQMLALAQQSSTAKLEIVNNGNPGEKGQTSLLLALHGNNSNIKRFKVNWRCLIGSDWLVALPQSSQLSGGDSYVWNDMEVTRSELITHYKEISRNYLIDASKSLVAGFSKGGQVAILSTLDGLYPFSGFIAIAPYIPDVPELLRLVDESKRPLPRGYFLLGEDDKLCTPGARELYEGMIKRGMVCGLKVFPELEHAFPPDFNKLLPGVIDFLLGKEPL